MSQQRNNNTLPEHYVPGPPEYRDPIIPRRRRNQTRGRGRHVVNLDEIRTVSLPPDDERPEMRMLPPYAETSWGLDNTNRPSTNPFRQQRERSISPTPEVDWTTFHNNKDKNDDKNKPFGECTICYDAAVDCTMYPCGHTNICMFCAKTTFRVHGWKCPSCRTFVKDIIKIYQ